MNSEPDIARSCWMEAGKPAKPGELTFEDKAWVAQHIELANRPIIGTTEG